MDWIIDTDMEPGWFLVRCGDVVDSRWLSQGAAGQRQEQLNVARESMVAASTGTEGRPWYSVLVVEDWDTGDGRYMETCEWESLPLPLWTLDSNEGGGHYGAEASGSIRTIERMADGRRIFATGYLGTTEEAQQTEQQIESQMLRFVSVDPAQGTVWEEEITQVDQDGNPVDGRLRFAPYIIGGATIVGAPACRFAVIWLDGMTAPAELTMPLPEPEARCVMPEVVYRDNDEMDDWTARIGNLQELLTLCETPELATLLASARAARDGGSCVLTDSCGGPALPPIEWFEPLVLEGPTPLGVEPSGEFYGHLALWDRPHLGFLHYQAGQVLAPHNASGYAHFLVHRTPVACCSDAGCGHDRQLVATGVLAFGSLHAGERLTPATARRWYEDSSLAGADVTVGEDQWGIWVHGALRPGMDDARVREILGSTLSGDWRRIGGQLELVAALGVNSGGFPITASATVGLEGIEELLLASCAAPGEPEEALVASLASRRTLSRPLPLAVEMTVDVDRLAGTIRTELERQLAPVLSDLRTLQPLVAERLDTELAALDCSAS